MIFKYYKLFYASDFIFFIVDRYATGIIPPTAPMKYDKMAVMKMNPENEVLSRPFEDTTKQDKIIQYNTPTTCPTISPSLQVDANTMPLNAPSAAPMIRNTI